VISDSVVKIKSDGRRKSSGKPRSSATLMNGPQDLPGLLLFLSPGDLAMGDYADDDHRKPGEPLGGVLGAGEQRPVHGEGAVLADHRKGPHGEAGGRTVGRAAATAATLKRTAAAQYATRATGIPRHAVVAGLGIWERSDGADVMLLREAL